MSYQKPTFRHPQLPRNGLDLTRSSYEGLISTLCAGCGHDSISAAVIQACWELDIEPHRVAKVSGCLLYTSPSPRDKRQSRMPSSA